MNDNKKLKKKRLRKKGDITKSIHREIFIFFSRRNKHAHKKLFKLYIYMQEKS